MTSSGPPARPIIALSSIGLAALAFSVMQSLVVPALPTIQRQFHSSAGTVTWLLTGYLLTASIATPIIGRIGDVFGMKRTLVATLCTLCLGTIFAALAHSMLLLIAARLIQGIGGALFPLAFGIIRDQFPRHRVAGAIGLVSSTMAFGGGLGIVLAGPIVDHLSYHWLFWIPAPIILAAAIIIAFFVSETPKQPGGRISWLGAVTLSAWLMALLLGVTEGPSSGWSSPKVLILFGLFVVLALIWFRVESRSDHPLVDITMLLNPTVMRFNIVALFFGFVIYASFRVVPQFLQTDPSHGYGFGASITTSGLYLLPQTIVGFIIGMMSGRIAAAVGSARAVLSGAVVATASLGLMALAHAHPWQMLLGTSLLGAGIGLAYSALPAVIVDAVPPSQTGIATGINTNIRTIGGSMGSQATGAILATGVTGAALPGESAFTAVFAAMCLMSILAIVFAYQRPRLA